MGRMQEVRGRSPVANFVGEAADCELTLEPGASVALVARAHGVNANQVFKWRRALKRGELSRARGGLTSLSSSRCDCSR